MSDAKSISIPERFDFSYHKNFTDQYQGIFDAGAVSDIVLDFSKVNYLDSSALGMMVLFQKKAKSMNVRVKIRGAQASAREILEIANFDKLFDIV